MIRPYPNSACGAGDRIKPGVERDSAKPQEYGATNPIKPAKRGAVFVVRAFIIIEFVSIAVARFAGLLIKVRGAWLDAGRLNSFEHNFIIASLPSIRSKNSIAIQPLFHAA